MTATRDPDRLLRAWLDLMPNEAPDRVITSVLQATATAQQARALPRLGPRRFQMTRLSLIAAGAAMIVVLLVGGALLLRPSPNIGPPTPAPSTPAPSAPPTGAPSATLLSDPSLDGPIVLSATDGIYLVKLDGTTEKLAIDGAVDTSCPTFSPDGRRFAVHTYDPVTNKHNLMVRALDGVEHGLWDGDMSNSLHQIRWAAKGSTLMMNGLLGGRGGTPQTFVGNANTGSFSLYDWWGGEMPGSFALSPDGSQVAVVRPGTPSGTSRIDLHDLRAGSTRIVARGYISDVAWSPDGTTISYTAAPIFGGTADLHFMNVDGSFDRLVYRGESAEGFGFMAWSVEWDILGVLERVDTRIRIRVLDTDGRDLGLVGPFDRSGNLSFTWAPGGDAVLLTTSARTGGLTGGPPMIAYLDGRTFKPGLPAGTATGCPLGWGRASRP